MRQICNVTRSFPGAVAPSGSWRAARKLRRKRAVMQTFPSRGGTGTPVFFAQEKRESPWLRANTVIEGGKRGAVAVSPPSTGPISRGEKCADNARDPCRYSFMVGYLNIPFFLPLLPFLVCLVLFDFPSLV